jgi:hypothetical protein
MAFCEACFHNAARPLGMAGVTTDGPPTGSVVTVMRASMAPALP